jgi:hypothetical protein
VKISSLLTVSDAGSANHELRADQGLPRRHGQAGAFASELEIDPRTLELERGQDLVDPGVRYWNYATGQYGPTPSPGQLLNEKTGRGHDGQIYFGNEENGDEAASSG